MYYWSWKKLKPCNTHVKLKSEKFNWNVVETMYVIVYS